MSDIYLMVNNNRIDLPESTIKAIKKSFDSKSGSDRIVEEFKSYIDNTYKEYVKIEYGFGVLKILYPGVNKTWTYIVWDACKKFCEKNSSRYPIHDSNHDPKYLYVNVEKL